VGKPLCLIGIFNMEIFKDIIGYEGFYQVSNLGTVKRINSKVKRKNHFMELQERIMIPLDNGKGYLRIKLSKNNLSKRVMLHRIIAEVFIENTFNNKYINHINGIKKDNRIENLEWCTASYNCRHAFLTGLRKITQKQRDNSKILMKIIHNNKQKIKDLK
jgi:hypothetical protein